jgi:hypothetical protein
MMRFDFLIQPLKEPPLRGSPPLRKGIVIKGGRLKKSKRIIASVLRVRPAGQALSLEKTDVAATLLPSLPNMLE